MASGQFHSYVAHITSTSLAAGLLWSESPLKSAIFIGLTIGILVTPDLDHHKKTHEETRLIKFNEEIGYFWKWWTTPYSKWFKHRGISHWHIIGTLTRVPWVAPFAIIFAYLLYLSFEVNLLPVAHWILLGWTIQDSLHILTDFIYSSFKRMQILM